jgi:DNA-3-methyladenine glycosylase
MTSEVDRGPPASPLGRPFFERPVDDLALALLGARLVRRWSDATRSIGRIVEVEAYGGPEDRASHARHGHTARNATMFGAAGHAYVYLVYGLHTCLNIVAGSPGTAGAVLVRAVMPEGDAATLRSRRDRPGRPSVPFERLASGPGNVGRAFGIDLDLDGTDLTLPGALWLEPAGSPRVAPGREAAGAGGRTADGTHA